MLKRPVTSDSCVVGERTDNRGGIVDSSMGGKGISRVHAAATRLASSAPGGAYVALGGLRSRGAPGEGTA